MMLCLIGDVLADPCDTIVVNRECGITRLPRKRRELLSLSLDPFGGFGLGFFEGLAYCDRSTELK
jgi:hypothetical protein